MKVHIVLPPDRLVSTVRALDRQGNEVEVAELIISPIFFQSDSRPDILFGRVTSDDDESPVEFQKFALSVKGSNGKIQVSDRSQSVKPAIEADLPPSKVSVGPSLVQDRASESDDLPSSRRMNRGE